MTVPWTITFNDSNIEHLVTHLAILTDIQKEMSMQYSDFVFLFFYLEMEKKMQCRLTFLNMEANWMNLPCGAQMGREVML